MEKSIQVHFSTAVEMTILQDNGVDIGVFVTINKFKQLPVNQQDSGFH